MIFLMRVHAIQTLCEEKAVGQFGITMTQNILGVEKTKRNTLKIKPEIQSGTSKSTEQHPTPEEIMQKLRSDLSYWQRQLRLDNLDITLEWSESGAEDGAAGFVDIRQGYISYYGINMIHPSDKMEEDHFNTDYEVILVHELLHVRDAEWEGDKRLAAKEKDHLLHRNYEWAIDCTAEALVRARRGMTR
jgi:hypothetical protein